MNISTSAVLNGTLLVRLIDGFVPQPGDEFTLMTFASRSGEFSEIDVNTGDVDLEWSTIQVTNILRAVGADPLMD